MPRRSYHNSQSLNARLQFALLSNLALHLIIFSLIIPPPPPVSHALILYRHTDDADADDVMDDDVNPRSRIFHLQSGLP